MAIRIAGIGTALPEKVVTNDDLAQHMDTSDTWIRERSGIGERRVGGTTSTMAIEAAQKALDAAGATPAEIGLVVLCTTTPDQTFPATSAAVCEALDLTCGAFDLNAVCAGFPYGFITAYGIMCAPGGPDKVLLIGSDAMSSIVDWTDRGTAILFGDGAGAVVMEKHEQGELLSFDLGVNGSLQSILYCDLGDTIKMEGREVFKRAVRAVTASVQAALDDAGISADEVDVVLPHQANIRIIDAMCKRIKIPMEKTYNVLEFTGNTSGASIPLAMARAQELGALEPGKIVLMTGFGAGMAWGTAVVRW